MTSLNVPSNLTISFYLLKQCKLWVWDFDDTLIDTQTYLTKDMSPNAIRKRTDSELDTEVPQWRYFKQLVEFLVMHGRYVGIASFGTYEIIRAYIDRIMGFNQHFFTSKNIVAPCIRDKERRNFKQPPNKNEYIYQLMRIYRVQDFKRVVLFDDLPSNIADAITIGVVAIQIDTPNNGANGNNMYFGPWIMEKFDNKIKNECGSDIYLNRKYFGVSNSVEQREPYFGGAFDKIDFGNGIQEKFAPVAFGTSIGSRKVSIKPEYNWNYRNVTKPPQWINGNWVENTLGGETATFWDKHQIVTTDSKVLHDNEDPYKISNVQSCNGKLTGTESDVLGFIEGFNDKSNDNYCGCSKIEWSLIVLALLVVLAFIGIVIFNV
jgi:hypothetical protein